MIRRTKSHTRTKHDTAQCTANQLVIDPNTVQETEGATTSCRRARKYPREKHPSTTTRRESRRAAPAISTTRGGRKEKERTRRRQGCFTVSPTTIIRTAQSTHSPHVEALTNASNFQECRLGTNSWLSEFQLSHCSRKSGTPNSIPSVTSEADLWLMSRSNGDVHSPCAAAGRTRTRAHPSANHKLPASS